MKEFSEQEILDGLKNEKSEVFRFVIDKYRPYIVSLVTKNSGSVEDAEDIFQESFLAVLSKIQKGNLQLSARFSTYFYGVCQKKWLNELKKRRRKSKHEENYKIDLQNPEDDSSEHIERRKKLYEHYYDKLSDRCRLIIRLSKLYTSIREIANDLKKSEGYIKTRKSTCIKRLIKLIKENKDKI